ncbi:hypothetical protein RSOLAG22IIIB_08339 [Rhizoctonia solani]|uniref:Uncharacterized protein n=1 Tax=Rhizoctonia solani TaxID=456999 RepID=A0A0K6FSP2_9AGAM|nr:hypothetical protein RSOLAG22IIIB_08339 [Rhizoctonia solani]
MPSITQSSCYADVFDAIWQTVDDSETRDSGQSLADTLVIPFEEKPPHHLSEDQIEADKVLLDMLLNNIPQTIVRSITRSNPYDILVPSSLSTAPYIAISYADNTEEQRCAFISDMGLAQDPQFLTIPPSIIHNLDEEDSDESSSDSTFSDSNISSSTMANFDELGDLESTITLEHYFSECDDAFETIASLSTTPVLTSAEVEMPNFRDTVVC